MTAARALDTTRPLCADEALARAEPLAGTASRIGGWLLVEYGGQWPYEPLDATVFAGGLGGRIGERLREAGNARLCLVKRPGATRRDGVTVFYGTTPVRGGAFRRLELDSHGDLEDLDLVAMLTGRETPGEPLSHPLLLVCTHGVRDRCCAKYGQELCRALSETAPDGWVWQTSHVGGDRFAGNLVTLPEGFFFGRVGREEAPRVLEAYLDGRIDLRCYRGRSSDAFPIQAAEAAVRERTGLVGFWDLHVVERTRLGDGLWELELLAEVSGDRHRVRVERRLGEPELLTCRAAEPRSPRHFDVSFV
jgi:hypothetical protein